MSMMFDAPMAAPPPPAPEPVAQLGGRYRFVVVCQSGARKEFVCDAEDFVEARKLLADFVREN